MNNNCEIIDKQGILGRGDMTWEISQEDEGRQESLNCYLQEDQAQ